MNKADDKRDRIVERLADFMIAEGPGAASLRGLAAAAGTSDRMLLYYFKDKDAIVAATLQRAAQRLTATLAAAATSTGRIASAALEAEMLALVPRADLWPFMAMWIEVAALAARGDPLYHRVGREIALGFLGWIGERIDVAPGAARDEATLRLMRTIEGALHLRAVGLP
jgi:AcrR family transcriptional regulator